MSADLSSQLGNTLGTAYTIERELRAGGMARVFVAVETALARRVVIKVLSPDLAAGVSAQRFAREIRLAASLQQANIVPVLSTGETEGLPYYTMPFVEGLSLRDRMQEGRLPVTTSISILRDVARALAFAHEHGVVHRDIKPENILLSGDSAVVTDFGIARALTRAMSDQGAVSPEPTITQFGSALGTPAYMAPEQVAADPNVDHRADIYAFGCLAYELVAGESPFAGRSTQQLLAAHLGERPIPLSEKAPDCAPAITALVMQCLEKDAGARPQSARELLTSLEMPNARATGLERLRNRITRRQRHAAVGVAAAALAVLAIPAWNWLRGGDDGERVASLAVIPFTNIGGDTAQEYLAQGMADELTTALGKVAGVRIVSRAMTARYRGRSDLDAQAIGRELGVNYILHGTVRRAGEQLRVSTQLVSSRDNSEAWSEAFAGTPDDAYQVQDSITRAVGHTLQRRLGGAAASLGVPAGASIGTKNPQAYDLYMRGKLLLARRGSGVALAIEKFEQAIALDSTFARAYAGLGIALELLPIFTPTPAASVHDRAIRVARQALALDSTQAEAYTTLALAHQSRYEWEPALAAHRHAIALDSTETDARVQYARLLYNLGRFELARVEFDRARRLDPYSAVASAWSGHMLFVTGRTREAIAELERTLEIDSLNTLGLFMMSQTLLKAGHRDSAKAFADRLVRTFPGWRMAAGVLYALLGERAVAEATLKETLTTDAVVAGRFSNIAMIALALRDSARALDALERATDAVEPWPTWGALGTNHFDPVLGSARFSAVLRRVRLDERTFKTARSGGAR